MQEVLNTVPQLLNAWEPTRATEILLADLVQAAHILLKKANDKVNTATHRTGATHHADCASPLFVCTLGPQAILDHMHTAEHDFTAESYLRQFLKNDIVRNYLTLFRGIDTNSLKVRRSCPYSSILSSMVS